MTKASITENKNSITFRGETPYIKWDTEGCTTNIQDRSIFSEIALSIMRKVKPGNSLTLKLKLADDQYVVLENGKIKEVKHSAFQDVDQYFLEKEWMQALAKFVPLVAPYQYTFFSKAHSWKINAEKNSDHLTSFPDFQYIEKNHSKFPDLFADYFPDNFTEGSPELKVTNGEIDLLVIHKSLLLTNTYNTTRRLTDFEITKLQRYIRILLTDILTDYHEKPCCIQEPYHYYVGTSPHGSVMPCIVTKLDNSSDLKCADCVNCAIGISSYCAIHNMYVLLDHPECVDFKAKIKPKLEET